MKLTHDQQVLVDACRRLHQDAYTAEDIGAEMDKLHGMLPLLDDLPKTGAVAMTQLLLDACDILERRHYGLPGRRPWEADTG